MEKVNCFRCKYKKCKAVNCETVKAKFEKCYLDHVGLVDDAKKQVNFCPIKFTNPPKKDKTYKDPDAKCDELYNDLISIYKCKFCNKGYRIETKGNVVTIENNEKNISEEGIKFSMSSDFIGPSRKKAKNVGMDNCAVGMYLRDSRILGGHIFFPKSYWKNNKEVYTYKANTNPSDEKEPCIYGTINMNRGGVTGYDDRIDYTLMELKFFYEIKSCEDQVKKNVLLFRQEYIANNYSSTKSKKGRILQSTFNKYKEWLEIFGDFEGFVDFFSLNDFCKKCESNYLCRKYDVYDLASFDENGNYEVFNFCKSNNGSYCEITNLAEYDRFVKGNVHAIQLRNKRLQKECEAFKTTKQ